MHSINFTFYISPFTIIDHFTFIKNAYMYIHELKIDKLLSIEKCELIINSGGVV